MQKKTQILQPVFCYAPRRGFEPLIPWMKTMCPRPLDERGSFIIRVKYPSVYERGNNTLYYIFSLKNNTSADSVQVYLSRFLIAFSISSALFWPPRPNANPPASAIIPTNPANKIRIRSVATPN